MQIVAVDGFEGNAADPVDACGADRQLKKRLAHKRIFLVGDRSMLTEARIDDEIKPTLDHGAALDGDPEARRRGPSLAAVRSPRSCRAPISWRVFASA
jgi:hypothetical protein